MSALPAAVRRLGQLLGTFEQTVFEGEAGSNYRGMVIREGKKRITVDN